MNTITLVALGLVALTVIFMAEWALYRWRNRSLKLKTPWPHQRLAAMTQTFVMQVRERGEDIIVPPYLPDEKAFRAWIEREITPEYPRLSAWLNSLSKEGFSALTLQMARFLEDLNINLKWLIDGDFAREPFIEKQVREIVIGYCQNCLLAIQIQAELTTFGQYQEDVESLALPRNRNKSQRLLEELRQRNLAPTTTPDLLLATEEDRYEYVLKTLKAAAAKDRATFDKLMAEVNRTTLPKDIPITRSQNGAKAPEKNGAKAPEPKGEQAPEKI